MKQPMPVVTFFVPGTPATQGSKQGMVSKYPAKRTGRHFVVVKDDNPRLPDWRNAVAWYARRVHRGELLAGPVKLRIVFVRARPKSHFVANDPERGLKANAPTWVEVKPDTLKMARAVEDALTSVIWRDDAQVALHELAKRYGHPVGAHVKVWRLI